MNAYGGSNGYANDNYGSGAGYGGSGYGSGGYGGGGYGGGDKMSNLGANLQKQHWGTSLLKPARIDSNTN